MSITDELREWANGTALSAGMSLRIARDQALAIADRIDAEHERAIADAYGNGVMSVPIALDESAWVKLPVDAGGKPIRIGDVMKGELIGGGYGEPFTVVGYVMSNGELEPMDGHNNPRKHKYLHHHKQPTVEDVPREFAEKMNENLGMYTGEAIEADEWRAADKQTIAEYAACLQLREDA